MPRRSRIFLLAGFFGSAGAGNAIEMGNGRTIVVCEENEMEKRSLSIKDSSSLLTVSRKLLQYCCVWKPTRSAPSMPCNISLRHGQILKASGEGHGICQKSATCASGREDFISAGKSAR